MSNNRKPNFNYKKKLSVSQNFMTSYRLLDRIVNLSNIKKQDTVIEIGTGKGHLTNVLCKKSGSVYSIEIDDKLFKYSQSKLSNFKNLKLIHSDFLEYRLPLEGDYKIFSNIPYFITTQIIDKITNTPNKPSEIWIVVEKGAAKRFLGVPTERKRSLLLKVNWDLRVIYHFKKDDFHPKPSVDSVLLHLSKKDNSDLDNNELVPFEKFIDHSLKYGLLSNKSLLTRKQVRTALKLENLPPLEKNQMPTYSQWICLFKCYQKFR